MELQGTAEAVSCFLAEFFIMDAISVSHSELVASDDGATVYYIELQYGTPAFTFYYRVNSRNGMIVESGAVDEAPDIDPTVPDVEPIPPDGKIGEELAIQIAVNYSGYSMDSVDGSSVTCVFNSSAEDDPHYLVCFNVGTLRFRIKVAAYNPKVLSSEKEYTSSRDQIEVYNTLFGEQESWYNAALVPLYTSPEKLKLRAFFYGGFADESQNPTDAEWTELEGIHGFDRSFDLIRLPADKMNAVLGTYFGIGLEDVESAGFEGLTYLESTGCYYMMHTDIDFVEEFQALDAGEQADGTICLRYTSDSFTGERIVKLLPNGDGYRILSNVKIE